MDIIKAGKITEIILIPIMLRVNKKTAYVTNLLVICSFNIMLDYQLVNQLCETPKTINNKILFNYT